MSSSNALMWISLSVGIVSIAIVLFLKYLAKNDDYWKERGIPYSPRINFFQVLKMFTTTSIDKMVIDNSKKYGRIFGSFEMSTPILNVADPDILRDILVKDFNIFSYRRELKTGDSMVDRAVTILRGEDWKRVRTIITPAFTSKRMRQMSCIINECSKTVADTLEKHSKTGEPVDFKGVFGAFSMDLIASSAFGTKIDSYNNPSNIFVQNARRNFQEASSWKIVLILSLPWWVLKIFGFQVFPSNKFFKKATREIIKSRRKKQERYNDVLQILMDAADAHSDTENSELNADEEDRFGSIINDDLRLQIRYKKLSEDEMLAQCVLFFFVGYETSASTLTFMSYALATNPAWQEKLIAEVDEAFEKHSEMSYDVVRDMKILDAVMSETLRMYPALLISERTATEEYTLGNTGLVLEKGMRVAFPIYALHYDPEYFEEPNKFDPSRFMDTSKSSYHPYAYLPFGAGPRNCLGMRFAQLEIKVCMAHLLRRYRFRPHSSTKIPLEFSKGSQFLTVNELPLTVEKRTDV